MSGTNVMDRPTNVEPTDTSNEPKRKARAKSIDLGGKAKPKTPGQKRASADDRAKKLEARAAEIRKADGERKAKRLVTITKRMRKDATTAANLAATPGDAAGFKAIANALAAFNKDDNTWAGFGVARISEAG